MFENLPGIKNTQFCNGKQGSYLTTNKKKKILTQTLNAEKCFPKIQPTITQFGGCDYFSYAIVKYRFCP